MAGMDWIDGCAREGMDMGRRKMEEGREEGEEVRMNGRSDGKKGWGDRWKK